MERYVSDVRIAEADVQRREYVIAFLVGVVVGTIGGLGALVAFYGYRWRWY
jgi:Mg/Co/Ni transporter MgtE